MRVEIEVAPGELLDKVTILEIKLEKITDEDKLQHIRTEWSTLKVASDKLTLWLEENQRQQDLKQLGLLIPQLKQINQEIWDIEDVVRNCEREQNFDDEFVQAARLVYITNDKRAVVKKAINVLFNSDIMEEKSYAEYQSG